MVTLVVLPAEGLFVLHGGSGAVAWAIDTPPVQPSVGDYNYNPSAVFGNSTGQLVLMRCLGDKVGEALRPHLWALQMHGTRHRAILSLPLQMPCHVCPYISLGRITLPNPLQAPGLCAYGGYERPPGAAVWLGSHNQRWLPLAASAVVAAWCLVFL